MKKKKVVKNANTQTELKIKKAAEEPPKKTTAQRNKRFTFHVSSVVALVNIFELIAIVVALMMAFSFQFLLKELPCPLCLLQRFGFLAVAFGFLLNLRFGFKPSHYSIVILSSLFTAFLSLRQIALHVVPGTGAYGSTFMGYHLYTWAFIFSVAIMVLTALLLSVEHQYKATLSNNAWWRHSSHALFALVAFLLAANVISVLMECGLSVCPANPTSYMFSFFGR